MKEKANFIYLRAHHLLCLQGYQGYGYDEKFKSNMEEILIELKNNKKSKNIILTESVDDLCVYCPNLKEDICCGEQNISLNIDEEENKIIDNNAHVVKMDFTVLKKTKLKIYQKYSFDELISIVNKTFSSKKEAKEVCGECNWLDKCLWYQKRR